MKNKRWWGILVFVLFLGGGVWHGSKHRSTGPAEGVKIQGMEFLPEIGTQAATGPVDSARFPPIRIGTFNIHGCKRELDGKVDLPRTAKCLEKLDFAALQEVHGPGLFGGEDQAAMLGKQLKMAWLFTPTVREWYCLESGNGFLTSLPVTFWERIPLASHRDYSFRNVVLLGLKQKNPKGEERTIRILVTHLNQRYNEDRQAQLRAVIALFKSLEKPAILLGDLNSTIAEPQMTQLAQDAEVNDAVGKFLGSKDDPKRIDWIFCRGLTVLSAGILENDASDHPMVWAEVQ
jgi:endonuclease/exonuclease/phosphatase family metal-dependent hydrolase